MRFEPLPHDARKRFVEPEATRAFKEKRAELDAIEEDMAELRKFAEEAAEIKGAGKDKGNEKLVANADIALRNAELALEEYKAEREKAIAALSKLMN